MVMAAPVPAKPARREPPPLAPIEKKLLRRLASGREPIDDRLDLHGMTQAQAHAALVGFIHRAHARDIRIALVITGKGNEFGERGVLRRVVPLWLREPLLRALVSSVEEAARPHGGAGAFYVRLRRKGRVTLSRIPRRLTNPRRRGKSKRDFSRDHAMSSTFDVLALGNAIVDVLAPSMTISVAQGLRKGGMQLVDEARALALYDAMGATTIVSGGSAANTVAGLASFGAKAAFVGKVRDDEAGHAFTHDIKAVGVNFASRPPSRGRARRAASCW